MREKNIEEGDSYHGKAVGEDGEECIVEGYVVEVEGDHARLSAHKKTSGDRGFFF